MLRYLLKSIIIIIILHIFNNKLYIKNYRYSKFLRFPNDSKDLIFISF